MTFKQKAVKVYLPVIVGTKCKKCVNAIKIAALLEGEKLHTSQKKKKKKRWLCQLRRKWRRPACCIFLNESSWLRVMHLFFRLTALLMWHASRHELVEHMIDVPGLAELPSQLNLGWSFWWCLPTGITKGNGRRVAYNIAWALSKCLLLS